MLLFSIVMFTLINRCTYVSRKPFFSTPYFCVQKIIKQLWQTFPTHFRSTTYTQHTPRMLNIRHIIYWTYTVYIKHLHLLTYMPLPCILNIPRIHQYTIHHLYSTYTTYVKQLYHLHLIYTTYIERTPRISNIHHGMYTTLNIYHVVLICSRTK